MSTIDSAVNKLNDLLSELPLRNSFIVKEIQDIIDLLNDRTVLLLEWNEKDIQQVAREKLAEMENCEKEEIIENPLTRELVIDVIDLIDKYYDCNYGVTWETINSTLDSITLPDRELCRVKVI